METDILFLGRIFERIMIVLVGGICIYLGYRLFDKLQSRQGDLELKGQAFSLKLHDISPGIYFAIFGSLLLGFAIFTQLEARDLFHQKIIMYKRKPSIKSLANEIDQKVKSGYITKEQAYKDLYDLLKEKD